MTEQIQFIALLDALRWLGYYQSQGLIKLLGREKKRVFSLDRSFTVNQLAFIFNQDTKQLSLAMRDDPTAKWFSSLPWTKVDIYDRTPAFLNLICDSINFPQVPDVNFQGGELGAFSLKIPVYSKLIPGLSQKSTISIGLFEPTPAGDDIQLCDQIITCVPIEIKKL